MGNLYKAYVYESIKEYNTNPSMDNLITIHNNYIEYLKNGGNLSLNYFYKTLDEFFMIQ